MSAMTRPWRRRHLGTEADRATFRTLHTASLAAPALREGLNRASAERSIRHLHDLLGGPALALTDTATTLAWHGTGQHHEEQCPGLAVATVERGRTRMFDREELPCDVPGCPVRSAIVSPLVVEERVIGTLQVFPAHATAGVARAADEVAQWVGSQLELAELDASRNRLMEAEVRALRAQISPHFIYNSLGAIASFVRTDPDRARDLLPVAVPFLCIQPLVENAVRHGLETAERGGHIRIVARDQGQECVIEVEDDGSGEDPDVVRRALAGDASLDSIGLGNVDGRLRNAFGDDFGLAVETAPGAGTKVVVRVPKFARGVHA